MTTPMAKAIGTMSSAASRPAGGSVVTNTNAAIESTSAKSAVRAGPVPVSAVGWVAGGVSIWSLMSLASEPFDPAAAPKAGLAGWGLVEDQDHDEKDNGRAADPAGPTLENSEARGKHLLLDFSNQLTVHAHLGMTGSWHSYPRVERWRTPAHRAALALRFDTHDLVCFSPKLIELDRSSRVRRNPFVASLGPDLLAEQFDEEEAKRLEKKIKKNKFDFNDFLSQIGQLRKMGDLKSLLGMIPGMGKLTRDLNIDDSAFNKVEAIIFSMTPQERENPELLNLSRKKRIARGCGQGMDEINRFIKQFDQMRKLMHKMSKNPGMMGGMPGAAGAKRGGRKGFRKGRR